MKTLFKIALLILISVLLLSCVSRQERENRKYQKCLNLVRGDTDKFRNACQIAFPSVPTKYIKGETIIKIDTVEVPGEIIPCPEPTKENPKPVVECPPNKIINNNKESTPDTVVIQDQSLISEKNSEINKLKNDYNFQKNLAEAKQIEIDKLKSENSELKSSKQKGWYWFYGLLAVLIVGFVARFYFKR